MKFEKFDIVTITDKLLKQHYPEKEVNVASDESACGCNLCIYNALKNKFGDRLPSNKLYCG